MLKFFLYILFHFTSFLLFLVIAIVFLFSYYYIIFSAIPPFFETFRKLHIYISNPWQTY